MHTPTDDAPRPSTPAHRRAIWLLSIAAFASASSLRLCDPMLPELMRTFGATASETARVISVFTAAYGLMQLVYGTLGDRIGKYRLIAWITLACTGGSLMAATSQSLDGLIAARFLTGATAAGVIPLAMAWIGDTIDYSERQTTLARFLIGQVLGIVAGQFLGGLFSDTLGWRAAFFFMATVFFVVGLLVWREALGNPSTHHHPSPSQGRVTLVQQAKAVLALRWSRVVMALVAVEGVLVFGALAFVPSHLHQRFGLSLTAAGAIVAVFGAGGLSYVLFARHFVGRLGEQGLARAGGVTLAVAWTWLMLSPSWPWAVPACYLAGLGFYMLHNTLQTHATQMAPQWRGTAVALFASTYFVGQSAGVSLASWGVGTWGSASPFTVAALGLPVLGWVFSRCMARRAVG